MRTLSSFFKYLITINLHLFLMMMINVKVAINIQSVNLSVDVKKLNIALNSVWIKMNIFTKDIANMLNKCN